MKEMDEELHIEMHRMVDELGKFCIHMTIRPDKPMGRAEVRDSSSSCSPRSPRSACMTEPTWSAMSRRSCISEHGTTVGASLVHLDIPMTINNAYR